MKIESLSNIMESSSLSDEVVLSFKGQSLKLNKAEDASGIAKDIKNTKSLTTLILEGNTLGIEAAEVIGEALKSQKQFKNALWSDLFTGRMKSEIPPALKFLSAGIMSSGAHLNTLDLSDNAFGPNGMIGLVDLLSSSTCYSLEVLKLNNNGLGVTGGKMLAKCLLTCHEESVKACRPFALKVFVSGRGRLETEGSIALSEAFKAIGTLVELSMPQNGITHTGITALSEALGYNRNLRVLNLNDNTFTVKGARSMAKMLKKQKNLESVDFSDCLLRNNGAILIASSLAARSHAHLQSINLSFNEILVEGGVQIVKALQGKKNLNKILLDGNMFDEEGIDLIKSSAKAIHLQELLGDFDDDEGIDENDIQDDPCPSPITSESDSEDDIKSKLLSIKKENVVKANNNNGFAKKQENIVQEDIKFVKQFIKEPLYEKINVLAQNKARMIVNFVEIESIECTMDLFVNIINAYKKNDPNISEPISISIDYLFKTLFSECTHQSPSIIVNHILCRLGLIKSEDKSAKIVNHIYSALYILSGCVSKDYFDRNVSEILLNYLQNDNCHKMPQFCNIQNRTSLEHTLKVLQTDV